MWAAGAFMFFEYVKNFTDYKLFSLAHILFFVFGVILAVSLSIVLRNRSEKTKRIILIVSASLIVFNYVFLQLWRVWAYADGRGKGILDQVAYIMMPNEILPFQLCSLLCYLVPAAVIVKKKWFYNALAPICIMGGFLFFFFPDGILNRYAPFSFRVLESVIQHTVLLFFGFYLYVSKTAEIDIKSIRYPFILMGFIGVVAIFANLVFGSVDDAVNFLYIRKDILGLGLPSVVTALIMAAVFTAFMFAVLGVRKLVSFAAKSLHKGQKTEKQE